MRLHVLVERPDGHGRVDGSLKPRVFSGNVFLRPHLPESHRYPRQLHSLVYSVRTSPLLSPPLGNLPFPLVKVHIQIVLRDQNQVGSAPQVPTHPAAPTAAPSPSPALQLAVWWVGSQDVYTQNINAKFITV